MLKINEKTTLYHGSYCEVKEPKIEKCHDKKDFGKGFYLTTDKHQAEKFANTSRIKNKAEKAIINTYEFTVSEKDNVLIFKDPTRKWFKYVVSNRSEANKKLNPFNDDFDIVVGKIADDATAQVINFFLLGVYGKPTTEEAITTAINRLIPNRLSEQICIKKQKVLDKLIFISSEDCTHE